ncbi:MAG: response regulator [Actinobacteria bacterium]|nr:response regulator [Actinomycetota bacterium]
MTTTKTLHKEKILVIDDSQTVLKVLEDLLEESGCEVHTLNNGKNVLQTVKDLDPDLVLLDIILPDADGFEICKEIKRNPKTSHIPVIMLTVRGEVEDKVIGLEKGADDYITKPFESRELIARVKGTIRRTQEERSANPLTGLPGNILIQKKIKQRISSQDELAVLFADLDNFKSFNDVYGFLKGDLVIKLVGEVLIDAVDTYGNPSDFIGHIGGDDFIVITTPDKIDTICKHVIAKFDAQIGSLYREEDYKKGYIVAVDRQGKMQKVPIMTISVGAVTNEKKRLTSLGMVSEIGAELKNYIKQKSGSNYFIDRRY